ncbi:MAG TPA: hypothetical protein VGM90_12745 [Kofleriaceae bacterium]|jgi:hypothetical protein
MRLPLLLSLLSLAACGDSGSSSNDAGADAPPDTTVSDAPDITLADRMAAAEMTATTNALCTAITPFYWEIGDVTGKLDGAELHGSAAPADQISATSIMSIASASKWLFGAYVVEKQGGMADASAVPFLNFTSGYSGLAGDTCPNTTVDGCLTGAAGMVVAGSVGKFDYNGAHLQKLASNLGLGADTSAELATEVKSQIGTDIAFTYSQPQPAGGVVTTATQYAKFLRKLLVGSATPLAIATQLGAESVCTNKAVCPEEAVYSPIPRAGVNEAWHYGLAHWIEDDPGVGDGAFSSAGSFGFYPWVDKARTLYGVLARRNDTGGEGYASAACGRLIRKAWVTGGAQL